jgi:hypothetical protein
MRNCLTTVVTAAVLFQIGTAAFAQDISGKKQPGAPLSDVRDAPRSNSENTDSTGWTAGEASTHTGVTEEGPPAAKLDPAKGPDPIRDKGTPRSPH